MSEDIKKLSDYSHARLRTEMYLGSRSQHSQAVINYVNDTLTVEETTWVPAVFTAFREVFDNALDEVVGHGQGNRIDVTYDEAKCQFTISDNGRGIPIAWDEEHKCHKATLAMTEARAGRNFGARGEVAGTNGIGASVVNFCSTFFKMEIHRDGKKFVQEFNEHAEGFEEALQFGKPKIKDSAQHSGTTITFSPSPRVFPSLTLPEPFIRARVFEVALCNPHVKFYYNDEHVKVKPTPEKTLFSKHKPIIIDIKEDGFVSKFMLVPFFGPNEHVHTLVNNIPAFNGGVHVETFRRLFYSNLLTNLERESKRRKLTPNRSDVADGVLIYNITRMKAPNFDSQSKTRLINEEVGQIVKRHMEDEKLYKDIIKKYSDWIDAIYARCAERTMKKDAADIAKQAKKNLRMKVPGLMDATGPDRSKCILFLAEGLSAISGMASVRNPELHGGLGLRGKIMNVNGEHPKKVLESQALADIMNAVGLVIGEKVNRKNLRYGKVYVAHDMDPDGLNIGALLMNFFHYHWPELFDPEQEAFLHMFQTPFIIAEKGKQRKYWYAHNVDEFLPEDYKGWTITRAKGLGTLTEEDWKHSLVHPEVTPITDDGLLQESLDLVFNGKRSDDRKAWIGL